MLKKTGSFLLLSIFIVSINGCATAVKQNDLELQGLKNQVLALETQSQTKDEEINSLKESLVKEPQGKKCSLRQKNHLSAKQIQIALRNAGFDPGSTDGKLGKKTRDAIKAFQAANNLVKDGKVRKETLCLLKKYLDKKVK